jgi:hypothetical protein
MFSDVALVLFACVRHVWALCGRDVTMCKCIVYSGFPLCPVVISL